MATFNKGDLVRQKVPVIEGEVIGAELDQTTLKIVYLVQWTDAEGETTMRYFSAEDLEAIA